MMSAVKKYLSWWKALICIVCAIILIKKKNTVRKNYLSWEKVFSRKIIYLEKTIFIEEKHLSIRKQVFSRKIIYFEKEKKLCGGIYFGKNFILRKTIFLGKTFTDHQRVDKKSIYFERKTFLC